MAKSKVVKKKESTPPENDIALSELHEPIWSLVSFEKRIAGNLTYDEAVAKMDELIPQKVPGLCILTDDAAAKM